VLPNAPESALRRLPAIHSLIPTAASCRRPQRCH
jgi:hypothetical protein